MNLWGKKQNRNMDNVVVWCLKKPAAISWDQRMIFPLIQKEFEGVKMWQTCLLLTRSGSSEKSVTLSHKQQPEPVSDFKPGWGCVSTFLKAEWFLKFTDIGLCWQLLRKNKLEYVQQWRHWSNESLCELQLSEIMWMENAEISAV